MSALLQLQYIDDTIITVYVLVVLQVTPHLDVSTTTIAV